MSATNSPTLGPCPHCHTAVTATDVRISYATDGRPSVVADCPDCGTEVSPR